MHDRKGYKFFCFSNIFPYGDFEAGVERNLLVSSPNRRIIESIERALLSRIKSNNSLFLGEMQFEISTIKSFQLNLDVKEITVHSATPIVMRIPRTRYDEYGIKPKVNYGYVFWRETIPFEAFVKQLRDNVVKKTKEFVQDPALRLNGLELRSANEEELSPKIVHYRFIRSIAKPVTVKKERQIIIGSIWDLTFLTERPTDRLALEIALESGLGERNSLGFGFMNLVGDHTQQGICL